MNRATHLVLLVVAGLASAPALKAWESSCYLHPVGSPNFVLGHNCPAVHPFLAIEAGYRCEKCGDMGPVQDLDATGYGECFFGSGFCAPSLIGVFYLERDLRIEIQNRKILAVLCIPNGVTVGTRHCYCPTCESSPIIISLSDERYELTDAANGVLFDLDADGEPEQTAWTAYGSDEAFLALDRNENGYIDDFMEIFGDQTPQLPSEEPNGWLALAVWDDELNGGNEDGIIDADDSIFKELQLWVDENHNGFSERNELSSLEELDVEYLDLDFGTSKRVDRFGNQFRYWSRVGISGRVRIAWDIFFLRANNGADLASGRGLCAGSTRSRGELGVESLR